ncbi:MAG TPA: SGNH/GDSL hydrolase family protein [Gammaproteobacteria bacterium]|nr:SGNH/GDSL hydrolase family protein [Gammaproteobacteria bacterium]
MSVAARVPREIRRASLTCVVALAVALPALGQSTANDHWVATWATALVARPLPPPPGAAPPNGAGPPPAAGLVAGPPQAGGPPAAAPPAGAPPAAAPPGGAGPPRPPPPVTVTNQTLRQVVHTSIGGDRVRVVLSNVFGTTPLEVGAAAVALREQGSAVKANAVRPLTFGGQKAATILAGATLVSDPVELAVAPVSDLVVDLYVPGDLGIKPSPVTTHNGASQTNYVSTPGNHVGMQSLTVDREAGAWFLLARVEVAAAADTRAVVTFGDSITDGARSSANANARWPDALARRLNEQKRGPKVAVLNAGISGNRVLGDGAGVSALARFDKDVLLQTGVTHVVVMEGINDIGLARAEATPSADDLIAGHRQLIARAHARGLKIYGATLTPFEGAAYYTPQGEAKRQALNNWIRTSGEYDGVIDFDAVTRDPAAPSKFAAFADSGDHLHPGDAGYKAMGDAVDLALFK